MAEQNLLIFNPKLDEAQERLRTYEMSETELNVSRKDIYTYAPQAVREIAEQSGHDVSKYDQIAEIEPPPRAPEIDVNLDDELALLPEPSMTKPGLDNKRSLVHEFELR